MSTRFGLVPVVLIVLASPAAFGQSQATTGVIEGTVTAESGDPLPGVPVTVRNTDTNFSKVAVTNDRGGFRAVIHPKMCDHCCASTLLRARALSTSLIPKRFVANRNSASSDGSRSPSANATCHMASTTPRRLS